MYYVRTFITSETGVLVIATVLGFSFFSGEAFRTDLFSLFLAGDGGAASSLSILADFTETEIVSFFFFVGEL